jgi:hypothetical protein
VADFYIQGPASRGFWLEVKGEKGRQRPSQKTFQRDIEANGGAYFIARSVKDALEACQAFCGYIGIVDRRLESVLEQWRAA